MDYITNQSKNPEENKIAVILASAPMPCSDLEALRQPSPDSERLIESLIKQAREGLR